MKSKMKGLENFKTNTLLRSQQLTVFGGNPDPDVDPDHDKPGTTTSSSSGAGATIVNQRSQPLPTLGQKK